MARNWIAIGAVVASAALVGWLVVGLVGRSSVEPTERAAAPDIDSGGTKPAERSPQAEEEEDDIERQLATLAQALRLDETIEKRLLPPQVSDIDIPLTLDYRRPVRFWQPAFAAAAKARP